MWAYGSFCDEFYVSARLIFKLDLAPSRETVLHFFERIRRAHPEMTRLRHREDGAIVLDQKPGDREFRRYVRLDAHTLRFGCYNPSNIETVEEFGRLILTQAPSHLSLSDLDYDHFEVVYGFDLEYRGNHDELVAETLFGDHPLLGRLVSEGQTVIDCQPFLGIALDPNCETQAFMEIKGRTATYEVCSGEYEATPVSVCLTMRRYGGTLDLGEIADLYAGLLVQGNQLVAERVLPYLVQPLAQAIASRR